MMLILLTIKMCLTTQENAALPSSSNEKLTKTVLAGCRQKQSGLYWVSTTGTPENQVLFPHIL
jgi:hypothetical protein